MGDFSAIMDNILAIINSSTSATTPTPLVTLPESLAFLSFLLAPVLRVIELLQHPLIKDWVSLLFFGALAELSRRLSMSLWDWIAEEVFITAEFTAAEEGYDWMLYLWVNHKTWRQRARHFECETKLISNAVKTYPWLSRENPDKVDMSFRPQLLPKDDVAHWIKFEGYHVKFLKTGDEKGWRRKENDRITVSILSRSRQPFNKLLLTAKKAYTLQDSKKLVIKIIDESMNGGTWKKALTRERRSLKSVITEDGVKEDVLKDMKEFVKSQKWYLHRGVPWRRGYLLYGEPGTGKTSSVHAFASELGMEIYVLSLASSGMNDGKLLKAMMEVPPGAIVIMEDVDAALPKREKRSADSEDDSDKEQDSDDGKKPNKKKNSSSVTSVTLSGVLNAIDGIACGEGRILIMTTNHKEKLDAALIRPGRADRHIEYKLASTDQAKQLFVLFYPSDPFVDDDSSDNKVLRDMLDLGTTDFKDEKEAEVECVFWQQKDVEAWARKWAEAIPDREFSIAQLQGMLLLYKSDPAAAVEHVVQWVAKELRERAEAKAETAGVGGSSKEAKGPVELKDGQVTGDDATKVAADAEGSGKEAEGTSNGHAANGHAINGTE